MIKLKDESMLFDLSEISMVGWKWKLYKLLGCQENRQQKKIQEKGNQSPFKLTWCKRRGKTF